MAVVADSEILKNTGDAYVRLERPNKNFSGTQKLFVKAGANDTRYAYLYFGTPFPLGAKILSATLTLYNGTTLEGGADVEVKRITEDWSRNKVTWNNRPTAGGAAVIVSKGPADVPPETQWDFDLTNMLQQVSDGADWYGVRFTANDGKGEWFFGSETRRARLRPVLFIEWADQVDEPINLSPSNGNTVGVASPLMTWEWTDDTGSSALNAVRVQVASASDFSAGLWDSGWVASTVPELDLAGTTYPGAPADSVRYWRAQVRDANNVESVWSETESFVFSPKSAVTINNPAGVSPNAYVEESTPPILWSFPGVQVHWQVLVMDPEDSNRVIATSEKVTGAETGWTIPDSAKLKNDHDYIVRVMIWDDKVREGNGENTPYSYSEKQFRVQYTAGVTPVNTLTVERIRPFHWAYLEWQRGTAADEYEILVDGQIFEKVPAEDVDTVPGGYAYTLRTHSPRRDVTVEGVAVVNGQGSSANPSVTFNYPAESASLSEVDGDDAVMFVNYDKDYASAREQTVHPVVGQHPPVLIRQSQRGIEGSFSGYLTGDIVPSVSVEEEFRRMEVLRQDEGRTVLLTMLDRSFRCFISEVDVESFVDTSGVFYYVSFDFYEVF